ncbi:MAG: S8 family serine peptidase, partial [Bacteroidales bacterium]|nr:S8 family serine peptidase [Bacteroidales bacterium]MDZ4203631.1 S8 family serine peptidase [Bacteroidales bacterium]
MKKLIFTSLLIVICLFLPFNYYTKPATKSSVKVQENIRVIAHFNESLVEGNTITTQVRNIPSGSIRILFDHFKVLELKAVFLNRYNENGILKPVLHNFPQNETLKGWQEIIMEDHSRAADLIGLLSNEAGVQYAHIERPLPFKPCIVPNDPMYPLQWHLNNPSNSLADIRAEQAWNINKGRNDVIIAVCDGGVDYNHTDLDPGNRSRIIAGYDSGDDDYDPLDNLPNWTEGSYAGHGTNIAGIIGAITNNNSRVSGIMWNCKIMPVKMVGSGGVTVTYPFGSTNWDFSTTAFPSDVADAIDYAVNNGAHVINLSYAFAGMGWPINDVILRVPLLYSAISNAYNQNVVVVVAMGNEYNQGNPTNYPAAFAREVIAVGNTNNSLQRSPSSSTGPHIDVSAPGTGIYTTDRSGGTGFHSGTSMAAPIVSGVAGLIISQGLDRSFNLTNDDIRHILEISADDIEEYGIGFDEMTGYGKINAYRALALLDEPNKLYHGLSYGGNTSKTSLSKWIYTGGGRWGLASGMYLNVDRYTVTKRVSFEVPFCLPPTVWMRERQSACISAANPNNGFPWALITNVTETGFNVTYYAYYVRYNSAGQTINKWVSSEINSTRIAYTAIGEPNIAATAGPISGPSHIYATSSATFTINGLPQGSSIAWDKSPNLSYLSGQGTASYTVWAPNTSNGVAWINAVITGPCGAVTLPRKEIVILGSPGQPLDIAGFPSNGMQFGSNSFYEFRVICQTFPCMYEQVEWLVGGGTIIEGQGTETITVLTGNAVPGITLYFDVSVRGRYAESDWSPWLWRTGYVVDGIGPLYVIYPNPASSQITISQIFNYNALGQAQQPKPITTIRLVDQMGVTMMTQNFQG